MIEVAGEVLAREGGKALVRTTPRTGGCGRCDAPGGCGGAKITRMFQREAADFWLDNDINAEVGERVRVCIAEDASLNAALLGYMIPVVGIVVGAALGVLLAGADASDGPAVLGALAGLVCGALISRRLGRRPTVSHEPVLRRLGGDQA